MSFSLSQRRFVVLDGLNFYFREPRFDGRRN